MENLTKPNTAMARYDGVWFSLVFGIFQSPLPPPVKPDCCQITNIIKIKINNFVQKQLKTNNDSNTNGVQASLFSNKDLLY